jgi:hypothetical protein
VGEAQSGCKEESEVIEMTNEELIVTITNQRAALLAHQEKLTNKAPYLKDVCKHGLDYLGDAERELQSTEAVWGIVSIAMDLAGYHLKTVEDAVNKFGYDVVEIPSA